MLGYVALFLISLSVAVTAIWLYRWVSNRQGFNQITSSNPGPATKRWLKAQQSFNSLNSPSRKSAKHISLPNSEGGVKTPWGWQELPGTQKQEESMSIFRPVTRPCINCEGMYPHTFLGSRCPSCKVVNWKYQSYVLPIAIMAGAVVAATVVLLVLNKF